MGIQSPSHNPSVFQGPEPDVYTTKVSTRELQYLKYSTLSSSKPRLFKALMRFVENEKAAAPQIGVALVGDAAGNNHVHDHGVLTIPFFSAGKTALWVRYANGVFMDEYKPTVMPLQFSALCVPKATRSDI